MKMKKLRDKLRKNGLSISLLAVAVVAIVFSGYQSYAQRAELQKVKSQTQELSRQIEKMVDNVSTPVPATSITPDPTPTPAPKPRAASSPTVSPFYFPKPIFGQPTDSNWYEESQQKKNIESICKGSGGRMSFGECMY